jgi:hypothetical protein
MKKLPAVAVAAISLMGLAQAIDLPLMKEGLWSIRTQTTNNPGNNKTDFTQKLCRSHAYEEYARGLAKNRPGCKTISESLSGGVYTTEVECAERGTVIKSKTVATSQGDSAAHSESHATYTPAFHGMSEMIMIQDQKYLGSCPSGVGPGDRIAQDGAVTHTWKH